MDELDQAVGWFPRQPPEVSRVKAEAMLFDELDKTALLFHQGGEHQRNAMITALETINGFLRVRGFSGEHIEPLEMLRKELEYLYDGNRSIVLQPGINSRDDLPERHEGPGKHEIRTYAASCAQAIYQLGKDEKQVAFGKLKRLEADEKVAQAMQKWPAYDQSRKITGRTVKGWRDKFSAERWGKFKTAKYRFLVKQFVRDDTGRKQLGEVLKNGPPMAGGFRK